jgi:hypothetical protein
MKIASEALIQDLVERTHKNLNDIEKFKELSIEILDTRKSEKSWSILECIEHLNLFGDFYLPEIEKRSLKSDKKAQVEFKSSWFGNFFANSMFPKEKLNKMSTFSDKNPLNNRLDKNCIDRFISQQQKILELLDIARNKDLNKVKIPSSISKLVRLKLGDTFRIIINHNERHLVQANKLLKSQIGSLNKH